MHSDKAVTLQYNSVVRLFIDQNNNWLEIKNNTCFWQVHTTAKKVLNGRDL